MGCGNSTAKTVQRLKRKSTLTLKMETITENGFNDLKGSIKIENEKKIEEINEEFRDLGEVEEIPLDKEGFKEDESSLIEMKDALSSRRGLQSLNISPVEKYKKFNNLKEIKEKVDNFEKKVINPKKIKEVNPNPNFLIKTRKSQIKLKQRFSFTRNKKLNGVTNGLTKYLYVVTNKYRRKKPKSVQQISRKKIKLEKIINKKREVKISLSDPPQPDTNSKSRNILQSSSQFLAAPHQISGPVQKKTRLNSLQEVPENKFTVNRGKLKLKKLERGSSTQKFNGNESFNNSVLGSYLELSQDIDDSVLLDASNAEISFYGSNAELSVRHSCLSQTMNEEGQTLVNQYKLINSIGRGSFGKVVKALHTKKKKYYAIKILKKSKMKLKISLSLGTANGFDVLNEINIIKKMDHPHIVKLHEVIGKDNDEKVYLVMDYMKLGSILGRRYWKWRRKNEKTPKEQSTLKPERARKYFRQIAKAMDYCKYSFSIFFICKNFSQFVSKKFPKSFPKVHNVLNVVHRDLKPGNILVDDQDNAKLSDFGVSEMMDVRKKTQNKSGTRYYLPPEIFHEKMVLAGAIDIWSLGITLYYFIHGKLPFYSTNQDEFKDMLLNKEPEYDQNLEPSLINLLKKCLEKDPEKRIEIKEILLDEWVTNNGTEPLMNLPQAMMNVDLGEPVNFCELLNE